MVQRAIAARNPDPGLEICLACLDFYRRPDVKVIDKDKVAGNRTKDVR
jgi:hypothetical protein